MMQSLSAVTTADAQNGKFYIVWLDSSVKNDYHYYIDEFDAAYEKIVSTKDASSFVGKNIKLYSGWSKAKAVKTKK